jgi:hypothetical protein
MIAFALGTGQGRTAFDLGTGGMAFTCLMDPLSGGAFTGKAFGFAGCSAKPSSERGLGGAGECSMTLSLNFVEHPKIGQHTMHAIFSKSFTSC